MRLLSVSLLEGLPVFGEPVRVGSPLVRYEYNSSGNLVRIIGRDGNVKRSFGYKNNLTVSHTDAAGLVSEYEYDHYTPTGKVLRNWTSLGEEWRFTYHDGYTEVTDVLGRTEQYHYDYNNELTKRVFANGSTNLVECDKLRRGIYKTQSKFVIRYEFGLFCRLKSRVGLLEFAQLFRFSDYRTSILMKGTAALRTDVVL